MLAGDLDLLVYMLLLFMGISLVNLIRYMLKIRKVMKMHKDNPNIKGISIVNGQIKIIEENSIKKEEIVVETYEDPICKKHIQKKDAYRVIKEDKEYFFCSWECREAFMQEKNITLP